MKKRYANTIAQIIEYAAKNNCLLVVPKKADIGPAIRIASENNWTLIEPITFAEFYMKKHLTRGVRKICIDNIEAFASVMLDERIIACTITLPEEDTTNDL